MNLESFIRDVPDFPKPGIIFKDITPLLRDPRALTEAADRLCQPFAGEADSGKRSRAVDLVAAIESRGFIFGALVAERLKTGLVPIRKPGKLPHKTIGRSYELEYGSNTVEIHCDAVTAGQRVLLVDDLLATGGTMAAARGLVEELGGKVVGAAFVVELCFLNGRRLLGDCPIHSLIQVK